MVLLSACARQSSEITLHSSNHGAIPGIYLPEMPVAGEKVAAELEKVCSNKKCPNTLEWLNRLSVFRAQYEVLAKNH